jgi:hypothetical protein
LPIDQGKQICHSPDRKQAFTVPYTKNRRDSKEKNAKNWHFQAVKLTAESEKGAMDVKTAEGSGWNHQATRGVNT